MVRSAQYFPAVLVLAAYVSVAGISQNAPAAPAAGLSQQTGSSDASDSLPSLPDPATVGQIREFLRLSGDMDSLRLRWIAALDKNRAIGAPYWPESFWTAIKEDRGIYLTPPGTTGCGLTKVANGTGSTCTAC